MISACFSDAYYLWDSKFYHDVRKMLFSHVCRNGNKPAHMLAKHAICIGDFVVWMEDNPYFLE